MITVADGAIEIGKLVGARNHAARHSFKQEFASLTIAKCRGTAFVTVCHRPLDAVDRIAGDRVALAEIIEQGREC